MRKWLRLLLTPIDVIWCLSVLLVAFMLLGDEPVLWPMAVVCMGTGLFGMAFGLLLDKRRLLPGLLLAPVLVFALSFITNGMVEAQWRVWVLAALGIVPYLWCLRIAPLSGDVAYSTSRLLPAVLLLAISYALAFLQSWTLLVSILGWLGFIYILAILFIINHNSVVMASFKREGARALPPGILSANRGILIVVAILLAGVFFWRDLASLTGAGFSYLIMGIWWLMDKIAGLMTGSGEGGGGEGGSDMGVGDMFGEPDPVNPWVELITQILIYAVLIAVGIALLWAIYRISRKLIRAIRHWTERMWQRYRDAFADGYVDETQSLMNLEQSAKDLRDEVMQRLRKLVERPPRWEKLSNRERIRFVMKTLMQNSARKGKVIPNATPAELSHQNIIPAGDNTSAFIDSYQRARYSELEISDADAENARKLLR